MQRKKLMSLPIPPLTGGLALPDYTMVPCGWNGGKQKTPNYVYTACLDASTGEQVLLVDLYRPSGDHVWRLFQGKERFFRLLPDGSTSEAGIDHTFVRETDYYYPRWNRCEAVGDADKLLLSFIGKNPIPPLDPMEQLREYHRTWKQRRLKEQYQKIRERDESMMAEITQAEELPKEAQNWVWETLLRESRYLFYRYKPQDIVSGYCTHCEKGMTLPRPRQYEQGICPCCGSSVIFRTIGQMGTHGFWDEKSFYYLQKTSTGFCARHFTAARHFYPTTDTCIAVDMEQTLRENSRCFFEFSQTSGTYRTGSCFLWKEFRQSGEVRFCREGDSDWPEGIFYPGNLDQVLYRKDWFLSYGEAAKCGAVKLHQLFTRLPEYRFIQALIREGLPRLAKDCINGHLPHICPDGKLDRLREGSLRRALGIGKDRLPALREINPTQGELRLYEKVLSREKRVNLEEFRQLIRFSRQLTLLEDTLGFCTVHTLLRYVKSQEKDYLVYRGHGKKQLSLDDLLTDWRDYLGNLRQLGRDTEESLLRFPRNLKQAHDEAYRAVLEAEKQKEERALAEIEEKEEELNQQLSYETRKYLIRAPRCYRELEEEGKKLHHCVATYGKKIARGESIILFLREKSAPERPFFTVELNPRTLELRQCRGLCNCAYGKEVQSFLDQWRKERLGKSSKPSSRVRATA